MDITLVIPSLRAGGAERVASTLANAWVAKGIGMHVVTFSDAPHYFKLDPRIRVKSIARETRSLSLPARAWNALKALWTLRRAIVETRPDTVISFLSEANILSVLSLLGTGVPLVISERNMPELNMASAKAHWYCRLTYPWADRLVSVADSVDGCFDWIPAWKRLVIHNPAPSMEGACLEGAEWPAGADVEKKWLVGMGRLVPQKGFDMLLSAWSRIATEHPGWQLLILGDGPQRDKLEEIRRDLGLEESVVLAGLVEAPMSILRQAEIFVLSSRYEGLVNSAIEAMACGLPVVSFDCPGGISQIVRNGIDGMLVPSQNVEALASAMQSMMSDDDLRGRLSHCAPEVLERFSLDKCLSQWDSLFEGLLNGKRSKA